MTHSFFSSARVLLSAVSLASATLTLSSAAMALECKADADCGSDFYCEISAAPTPAIDCAPNTNCQPPTPEPAPTTGYCQAKPLSCTSDADCPEYLACTAPSYGCATAACPPGANCDMPVDDCQPPADAPKTCQIRPRQCKADADCFGNFQCVLAPTEVACATPACPPGAKDCPATDCPTQGSTPPEQGYCEPKEITCAVTTDCPADWSCVEFDETSCAGSGATPPSGGTDGSPGSASNGSSGSATPAPAPTPGNKPQDTSGDTGSGSTSCMTKVTRMCAPKGYVAASGGTANDLASPETAGTATKGESGDHQGSSASAVGAPGASGTGAASNGAASGSDDSTGCAVSGAGQRGGSSGLFALGAAGLVAFLARRRRA